MFLFSLLLDLDGVTELQGKGYARLQVHVSVIRIFVVSDAVQSSYCQHFFR